MKTYNITFSPTGGTKKVADILAAGLPDNATPIDLTDRNLDFSAIEPGEDDAVLIAVPSYSGRVPATAAERIAAMRGNSARAVIVCVYGNRAYDDTLAELLDTALLAGFRVVAAVAAVAEHSIVRKYAHGRPDELDTLELADIAAKISRKLLSGDFSTPAVPGNRPYRKAAATGFVPHATKACVRCGLCATRCPVGAINANDPDEVDTAACISCMRCVAECAHKARKVNPIMLAAATLMLKKACSTRKGCELYI